MLILSKETQIIRIDLQNKHKKMFEEIKIQKKLTKNTDVIRLCIETTYKEALFHLPEEMIDDIFSLLKHKNIKSSYNIFSHDDFIKRAVADLIKKLKTERKTLRSYTVRVNLPKEEQIIALALLELLNSDNVTQEYGVTLKQISTKLNWPISKVKQILMHFYNLDYVLSQEIEGIQYFYVPYPGE